MLAAWVEQPIDGGATTLKLRRSTRSASPRARKSKLEQPKGAWTIGGLSMSRIGDLIGLGYRRIDDTAMHSEIVLDILDEQGVRDRDSWVLTPTPAATAVSIWRPTATVPA